MNVPCSSTPAGPRRSATAALQVLSSAIWDDVDSHNLLNFEAQSHGPFTRCLRFAGWVAPPPRKTRFRMAGQPCPGGTDYPLGSNERFQLHPPFPGFAWRNVKLHESAQTLHTHSEDITQRYR